MVPRGSKEIEAGSQWEDQRDWQEDVPLAWWWVHSSWEEHDLEPYEAFYPENYQNTT